MKLYVINSCGVCINPDLYGTNEKDEWNYISIAQFDEGWTFGLSYRYDSHLGGGGFSPSRIGPFFDTKRDAVLAGVKRMKEHAAEIHDDRTSEMMQAAERAFVSVTELSLF